MTLFHPLGSLAAGPRVPVSLTPEAAGWTYTGLRVLHLAPGVAHEVETGDAECFVLPLAGGLDVVTADERFTLAGRATVFTGPTDFAYVGRDSTITLISTDGAEVALPSARCDTKLPDRYGPVDGVPVETRGGGPATRSVRNFGTDAAWPYAEKLVCCELITPPGNWSSYPPHKHDGTAPSTVVNEEIYWFRIAGRDGTTPDRSGFGYHATYTGGEHEAAGLSSIDERVTVRDGDTFLVPHGYHGPCMAAPGYPMYYLNVLAGPGPERSMAFCDDPAHAWVRDTWE